MQMVGSLGARSSHASVSPNVASSHKFAQGRGSGQDQGFRQAMQFLGMMMGQMGGGGRSKPAAPLIHMLNGNNAAEAIGNGHLAITNNTS